MDYMGHTVSIHSLGLGQTTNEGSYYAKVDGKNVGTDGRAFWETESQAEACARRFIFATENTK